MHIKLDKDKATSYREHYYQCICNRYFVYTAIDDNYEILEILNTEQGAKRFIDLEVNSKL